MFFWSRASNRNYFVLKFRPNFSYNVKSYLRSILYYCFLRCRSSDWKNFFVLKFSPNFSSKFLIIPSDCLRSTLLVLEESFSKKIKIIKSKITSSSISLTHLSNCPLISNGVILGTFLTLKFRLVKKKKLPSQRILVL